MQTKYLNTNNLFIDKDETYWQAAHTKSQH